MGCIKARIKRLIVVNNSQFGRTNIPQKIRVSTAFGQVAILIVYPPIKNQDIHRDLRRDKVAGCDGQFLRMGYLARGENNTCPELTNIRADLKREQFNRNLSQYVIGNGQTKGRGQLCRYPFTNLAAPASADTFNEITRTIITQTNKGFSEPLLCAPLDFFDDDGFHGRVFFSLD